MKKLVFFIITIVRMIKLRLGFKHTFYFESLKKDKRWYVKLDEFPFNRSSLEMVFGADEFLEDRKYQDYHSVYRYKAKVVVSLKPFKGYKGVMEMSDTTLGHGRTYSQVEPKYKKVRDLWLCPVMVYVFGGYPKTIYYT